MFNTDDLFLLSSHKIAINYMSCWSVSLSTGRFLLQKVREREKVVLLLIS